MGTLKWLVFLFATTTLFNAYCLAATPLTPSQLQALDEKLSLYQGTPLISQNTNAIGGLASSASGTAGTVEQSAPFSLASTPELLTGVGKATIGFDSNPLNLPSASRSESLFTDSSAALSVLALHSSTFDRGLGYAQSLVTSYTVEGLVYEGQFAKTDKIKQTADALYQGRFADNTLDVTLDGKYTNSLVHGYEALSQPEINPSLRYYLVSWAAVQTSYDLTDLQFHKSITDPRQRQSANRHTAGGTLLMFGSDQTRPMAGFDNPWFPGWFDDVTISYFHVLNDARGSDYVYQGDRLRVALDNVHFDTIAPVELYQALKPVLTGTTATLSYTRDWNNYSHPNSQLTAGANRRDSLDTISATIRHSFSKNVAVSAEYDYTNSSSNLSARRFTESVVTIGALLSF